MASSLTNSPTGNVSRLNDRKGSVGERSTWRDRAQPQAASMIARQCFPGYETQREPLLSGPCGEARRHPANPFRNPAQRLRFRFSFLFLLPVYALVACNYGLSVRSTSNTADSARRKFCTSTEPVTAADIGAATSVSGSSASTCEAALTPCRNSSNRFRAPLIVKPCSYSSSRMRRISRTS